MQESLHFHVFEVSLKMNHGFALEGLVFHVFHLVFLAFKKHVMNLTENMRDG